MRKAIPFLIPLLLSAPMLWAQQKQPLAKKQINGLIQKHQQAGLPAELKLDAELLQVVKREREKKSTDYVSLATLNVTSGAHVNKKDAVGITATQTNATVAVNITCEITPELVKVITNAGGVIVSSTKESNLIVANLPETSLQTIAESPSVKQINLAQSKNATDIKSGRVNQALISNTGKKDDRNIMAESVKKSRGLAVKPTVEQYQ